VLGDAIKVALNGRTTRLGHLLGPMGVRYVVIPRRVAPRGAGRPLLTPSRDVAGALAEQVDFRQLDATNDLSVFENAAWVPTRAKLSTAQASNVSRAGRGLQAASDNELAGVSRALSKRRSDFTYSGSVDDDSAVLFAETPSTNWHLRVEGKNAERDSAFGFGSVYLVPRGGDATLRYSTPILRWLLLLLEIAVWVVVIRTTLEWRRGTRGELV
jgi:hypothetical protein